MLSVARSTQDLIQDLCRQFGETTGWPLRYFPAVQESAETIRARIEADGLPCSIHPIRNGEICVGLLVLDNPEQHPGHDPSGSVPALAEHIGSILEQLALAEQLLAQRTTAMQILSNLTQTPRSEQPLGGSLNDLLAAAVRLAGYQSAAFYLLNPATNQLKLRAAHGLDSRSLPATNRDVASSRPDLEALSHGHAVVVRKSDLDDRWLPPDAQCGLSTVVQSSLVPIGTLWVYDRRLHPTIDREIESLQVVASHVALQLERAVLLHENQAQRRMQRELQAVSAPHEEMQRPDLPADCGFDVVYRCLSRHEVGGDLCEVESLTPQSTAIVVGDASGNSVPAALVKNAARGALKSMSGRHAPHDWHPSVVLDRLNRALHSVAGEHQFMSLFYGVYDASLMLLTYCNAGHPAPILLRDGQVSYLDARNVLLGIMEDAQYTSLEVDLKLGDLLVIYSDGITESRSPDHTLFGVPRVVEATKKAADDSVEAIFKSIWHSAEQHAGRSGKKKADDRTLLVMRVR